MFKYTSNKKNSTIQVGNYLVYGFRSIAQECFLILLVENHTVFQISTQAFRDRPRKALLSNPQAALLQLGFWGRGIGGIFVEIPAPKNPNTIFNLLKEIFCGLGSHKIHHHLPETTSRQATANRNSLMLNSPDLSSVICQWTWWQKHLNDWSRFPFKLFMKQRHSVASRPPNSCVCVWVVHHG